MALIRKKHPEWRPSENTGLQVGEVIEISDYRRLVENGVGDLVDETGTVLPLPGTVFVCGICYDKIDSHIDYVNHIMVKHPIETNQSAMLLPSLEEPEEDLTKQLKTALKKVVKKPSKPKKK